jgi:hypothetical protein
VTRESVSAVVAGMMEDVGGWRDGEMFGRSKVKAASVFAAASHSSPIRNSPGDWSFALSRVIAVTCYWSRAVDHERFRKKVLDWHRHHCKIPNGRVKPRLIYSLPALYIHRLYFHLPGLLVTRPAANTSFHPSEPSFSGIRGRVSSRRMLDSPSNTWSNLQLSTAHAATSSLPFATSLCSLSTCSSSSPYLGQVSQP